MKYNGIANNHLDIIEKVGGCILDDIDIMEIFQHNKFRDPYRYSLE